MPSLNFTKGSQGSQEKGLQEGGNKGGTIVAEGTPEEVVKVRGSFTGKFLKAEL